MKHILVWFRNDLRVTDNPALSQALQQNVKVSAVYIHCPEQWEIHSLGNRKLDFITANLDALALNLQHNNIDLQVISCDSFADVSKLLDDYIHQHDISELVTNKETGIYENQRDSEVELTISIPFNRYSADCIVNPGEILNKQNLMFKVFTPFKKSWLRHIQQFGYSVAGSKGIKINNTEHNQQSSVWEAGEQAAQNRLKEFCAEKLNDYAHDRDFPALDGGSSLSPYLSIGVLSARQCLSEIENQLGYIPFSTGEKGHSWLNELIWRDFYRHLMEAFPRLSKDLPFKPHTVHISWCKSLDQFKRWCDGNTGFPIVDAAMRCLNQTGYMHNRLRMICASFLVKDLQINWQWGEQYFMKNLIDADFPSNNGGWQWSAGTGADAAPYFRIFNPTVQGQRFDPEGEFILRWLPELKPVPLKNLHAPQTWLEQNKMNEVYVAPIVDHKEARQKTLALYKTQNK